MFEFVNYTYSGLLSIIAALIGLACPLIIDKIEGIDRRYHSTLLARRFMQESSFAWFAILMAFNIIAAIVVPFVMDHSSFGRTCILVQSGLMVALIASLFVLFYDMLLYVDPQKLQVRILEDFHKAKKEKNKKDTIKYFYQWVDLVPVILSSSDDNFAQSVYNEWEDCVKEYYDKREGQREFDDYFLIGLTRINENLCKSERRLISINNGNGIVDSLLYLDMEIPEKHYAYLWKNLLLQVYYDRDELLFTYWATASQHSMFLKEKEEEGWRFLEFNIFFVAMLLQQKKHELVKKMLTYTNSKPETYPLVPSTMSEILSAFVKINKRSDEPGMPYYYESKFSIPSMQGINDGRIVGAAYSYLALLMYRVYTLVWYYGEDYALNTGMYTRGKYLSELSQWETAIQILKCWLEAVGKNEELLRVVNYTDELIPTLSEKSHNHIPSPDEIVRDLEEMTEKAKKDTKAHQPLDEEQKESTCNEAVQILRNAMQPYRPLMRGSDVEGEKKYFNCSQTMPFPREAFLKNPSVSHVDIGETMSFAAINTFISTFGYVMYRTKRRMAYTISMDDLLEAIDALKLNSQYVILSVGMYWDYVAAKNAELKKIGESELEYRGVKIFNLPCNNRLFDRMLYVMPKEDMPSIISMKPTSDQVKKYHLDQNDKEYEIWTSILDIKEYAELKEDAEKKGVDVNQNVLFTMGWQPMMKIKEDIIMIAIRVWTKLRDAGNPDAVSDVQPINKKNE